MVVRVRSHMLGAWAGAWAWAALICWLRRWRFFCEDGRQTLVRWRGTGAGLLTGSRVCRMGWDGMTYGGCTVRVCVCVPERRETVSSVRVLSSVLEIYALLVCTVQCSAGSV